MFAYRIANRALADEGVQTLVLTNKGVFMYSDIGLALQSVMTDYKRK